MMRVAHDKHGRNCYHFILLHWHFFLQNVYDVFLSGREWNKEHSNEMQQNDKRNSEDAANEDRLGLDVNDQVNQENGHAKFYD